MPIVRSRLSPLSSAATSPESTRLGAHRADVEHVRRDELVHGVHPVRDVGAVLRRLGAGAVSAMPSYVIRPNRSVSTVSLSTENARNSSSTTIGFASAS